MLFLKCNRHYYLISIASSNIFSYLMKLIKIYYLYISDLKSLSIQSHVSKLCLQNNYICEEDANTSKYTEIFYT